MTFLRVPGATLHLEQVGPDNRTPIVMLHGGPGEAHDYLRPFFDDLASAERSVIYYDQRGAGKSLLDPGVALGDWQTHVRDLEAVRVHLGQTRFTLGGFSWGALLALLHALEHPERVARLVLVSPVPVHAGGMKLVETNLTRALARPEMDLFRARLAERDASEAERKFFSTVAPCLFDPLLALALTPVTPNAEAAQAAMQSLGDFDLRPRLGSLATIPSLVIYGAEDPVSAPGARSIAEAFGATCIALERCGHAPFIEAREPLFSLVTRFLDAVDRPRALR